MCLYFQGICECTNSMKHTETWVNKALRWFFTWLSYFFSWKILLYNVLVVFAIYKHESVIIIYIYTHTHTIFISSFLGLSRWLNCKEATCQARDTGSTHGLRRSSGEGNGNLLQYSWLGNPMDRGSWQATVHGVTESDTTQWLNNSSSPLSWAFLPCIRQNKEKLWTKIILMRFYNLIRTTYIQKTLIMVCKSNFRKIIQNEDVGKEIKNHYG